MKKSLIKKIIFIFLVIMLSAVVTLGFFNDDKNNNEGQKFDDQLEEELEDLGDDTNNSEESVDNKGLKADEDEVDKLEDFTDEQKDSAKARDNLEQESNNPNKVYVNLRMISQSHPAIREAEQELNRKAEKLEEEFYTEIDGLDQEKDVEKIHRIREKYQNQLQNLQLEEKALEKVLADVEKARKDLGYDLILDKMAVVDGGEDITEEIIDYIKNM